MPAKPTTTTNKTPRATRVMSPPRSSTRARTPVSAAKPPSKGSAAAVAVAAVPAPRPPLPIEHLNTKFSGKAQSKPLKRQELNLEGSVVITIVRAKVPVPETVSGHVVRRLDTGAVSASSLFRVSFPTASPEAEAAEMAYLAATYDTKAAGDLDENGRGKLTGTWVPVNVASMLASEYGCAKYVADVINFEVPEVVVEAPTSPEETERSVKRKRVASPSVSTPSRNAATVEVVQKRVTDPNTGEVTETTELRIDGSPNKVTNETDGAAVQQSAADVAAAIQSAKDIVEQVKQDGAVASSSSSGSKKRGRLDEENELEANNRSMFGKLFGRKTAQHKAGSEAAARDLVARAERQVAAQPIRRLAPPARTRFAIATAVVGVAAATLAPYLLQ